MKQNLLLALLIGFSSNAAQASNFFDFVPLTLGSYWTYQNAENPADTYTWSVFESFTFNGQPALKFGESDYYRIISNDSLVAEVDGGVLFDYPDVSFSSVSDGTTFTLKPSQSTMLRLWDNLDATKSVYNVDPALNNLLLIIGFDANYPSNSNNAILESNLGFTPPNIAVTNFQLNQQGIGQIIDFEVNAATGEINKRYNLVYYYIAPVPVPSAIWMFASALASFIGFNRRKTTQQ